MSDPQLQALILDDGELADVRDAFSAIGLRYAGPADWCPDDEVPLLVTNAPQARRMLEECGRNAPRHHLHVVVGDAEEESLGDLPCDFLLRRPVSKEVLRLLAERARYEGRERRRMTRVALGAQVTLRNGSWEQEAILAQLSVGGCGLVAGFPLDEGSAVLIELPKELTGPRHLEISGRVLCSRRTTTSDGTTFDVSVAFDALQLSDRVTMRALMAGQPIDFRPHVDKPAASGSAPRRGARRRLVAGASGVARVVIGRDLCQTGMRIELDPCITPGASVELALYGNGSSESVILRGRAEKDPEREAWRVHFEDVDDGAAEGIERLCSALGGDGGAFVIAEILERSPD